MNRARRRGIENEQKGPSCLDRNVKIIGRALSTGLQETMTTEGGRGRFQGCPLNLRLSLSSLSLSRWKTRYRRTLSRTNERRYLARESSTVSQRGFSRKVSCIFQRLIPRNIPFHWGGGSHPTSRILRLLGRNLGQFADVTYLTILEIVSINLSEFWQFLRPFFHRSSLRKSVRYACFREDSSIWTRFSKKGRKEEDFGLFLSRKLFWI